MEHRELRDLIPRAVEGQDGHWPRFSVGFIDDGETKEQPIVMPEDEQRRMAEEAEARGISRSALMRRAVVDLAKELAPRAGIDIDDLTDTLAEQLGEPRQHIARRMGLEMRRFRDDLIRLADYAGISMSRAARWALNVCYERSNDGSDE